MEKACRRSLPSAPRTSRAPAPLSTATVVSGSVAPASSATALPVARRIGSSASRAGT